MKGQLMSEESLSTTQATEAIVGLLGEGEDITALPTTSESSVKPVKQVSESETSENATGQVEEQPDAFVDDVVTDADLESHAEQEETDIEQQAIEETQDAQPIPTFRVKVDGVEYEVNQDELVAGYQRDSDYRRKTESLSIERQSFRDETDKKNQEISQRMDMANQAIALANQQLGLEEQNIAQLMETDPTEAQRQLFFLNQKKQALVQEQQKLTEARNQELQKYIASENQKLLLEMPEMRNPDTAKQVRGKMRSFLTQQGFSEEEMKGITNHKVFKIVDMAVKFNELKGKRSLVQQKVQNAPKVVKGGVVQSKEAKQKRIADDKMARLKKSGKTEDATDILKSIFEN
tara:strand:+ start:1 stop:1044 length:1044 start_codon:yes stop_codon:yes gene_type:complete